MTDEEAVKALETLKAMIEWNYPLDFQVALDRGIQALKKEIEHGEG